MKTFAASILFVLAMSPLNAFEEYYEVEGVKIKKLRVLSDDRGRLMEILRCDDELFFQFGQIYITTTYPGLVKAWHLHKRQTDNVACIHGMIKVALYDPREKSPTFKEINQFYLGVQIPSSFRSPRVFIMAGCVSAQRKPSS